jgi:hypothetical protein
MLSLLAILVLVGGIFLDAHKTSNTLNSTLITGPERIHNVALEHTAPHPPAIEETDFDALFEQMIAEEKTSPTTTLQNTSVDALQQAFATTKDPELITPILQAMVNAYQFVPAKQFIEKLTSVEMQHIDAPLHLQIAFNSFPLSSNSAFSSLQTLVETYLINNKLSTEQANRYYALLALMQRKYDQFFQLASQFQNATHQQFANKITNFKTQIAQQQDMPSYYFDALVSVELSQQGFFQSAKMLALYVHSKDNKYILPYQVLAYANFLTASREAAIGYLTILASLDPTAQDTYTFLIGVASYRNKQYESSVLHLSQVQNAEYRLDIARYLLLNYTQLQQSSKLLTTRQKLLGYSELKPADFYRYFYTVFFAPYAQGTDFTLYKQHPELAQNYLTVCTTLLQDADTTVCEYGEVGLSLATKNGFGVEKQLLKLIETAPQGYLYHALGEYYSKIGKADEAKIYLLKAIGMTNSTIETENIKTLLQKMM